MTLHNSLDDNNDIDAKISELDLQDDEDNVKYKHECIYEKCLECLKITGVITITIILILIITIILIRILK